MKFKQNLQCQNQKDNFCKVKQTHRYDTKLSHLNFAFPKIKRIDSASFCLSMQSVTENTIPIYSKSTAYIQHSFDRILELVERKELIFKQTLEEK